MTTHEWSCSQTAVFSETLTPPPIAPFVTEPPLPHHQSHHSSQSHPYPTTNRTIRHRATLTSPPVAPFVTEPSLLHLWLRHRTNLSALKLSGPVEAAVPSLALPLSIPINLFSHLNNLTRLVFGCVCTPPMPARPCGR